jgi:hypothetical protein
MKMTPHIFRRFRHILLIALLLFSAVDGFSSHFRYRTLTWARVPGNPYQVKFTITEAWRQTAYGVGVGATINTGTFTPNNGTTQVPVNLVVTSVNSSEDWLYGTYTYTHTYPSTAANYNAFVYESCCRIGSLSNNSNGSWYASTTVTVGNSNDAPVSTVPPIINVPTNTTATYQIPAVDPDGDAFTFAMAPAGSFGTGTTQPSGVSVSSNGLLSFNTVGRSVGSLWSTAVTITDSKGAKVILDLIGNKSIYSSYL